MILLKLEKLGRSIKPDDDILKFKIFGGRNHETEYTWFYAGGVVDCRGDHCSAGCRFQTSVGYQRGIPQRTDFSNMRSAYAEVMVAAISDDTGSPLRRADGTFQAEITLKQKQEGWQTGGVENMQIGGVPYAEWDSKMPAIGGTATVTFYPAASKVIIDWGGSGNGSGSGSGSIPAFHGTASRSESSTFTRGAVIQDETGTVQNFDPEIF